MYESLPTDDAVAALAELAAGGPVLEFGIGTGRLALPLVRQGLTVHGVDGSPDMVNQLREKPGGSDIPVEVGDFADATTGSTYALVLLVFHTIFALPSQEAQVACFRNAAKH
ncbi:MAG: class I SAM-dependent methyltransferase, partial [Actinomycetota bacterium]|nr:class I SAM-dependent methyltransferase [Actinomycetota bacterium]